MNIIICDDNVDFSEKLKNYLKQVLLTTDIYHGNYTIACVNNAEQLFSYNKYHSLDILFLDISMPKTDGFEIARQLGEINQNLFLIFISNYDEKVYYSLRFEPFRFVRKSCYIEEAKEALLSAIYRMTLNNKSILIKSRTDITYVRIPNIYYIEKEKMTNYLHIYTVNTEYRHRSSMNDMKLQLSEFSFLAAGQTLLINPYHIAQIQEHNVILDNKKEILLPAKIVKPFCASYLQFMRV